MPSSLFGPQMPTSQVQPQNRVVGPISQLKNMMGMIKASGNPNALMQQMAMTNPNYKQVMEYVNQNGGDPKKAFFQMAQEKGVNPESILSMLR